MGWESQLNFFFQAYKSVIYYQKMVHYHKKNNHNVSNFLGLKTARVCLKALRQAFP